MGLGGIVPSGAGGGADDAIFSVFSIEVQEDKPAAAATAAADWAKKVRRLMGGMICSLEIKLVLFKILIILIYG